MNIHVRALTTSGETLQLKVSFTWVLGWSIHISTFQNWDIHTKITTIEIDKCLQETSNSHATTRTAKNIFPHNYNGKQSR
uniref:Uncharacterized protein n=1 Tax=Cucumis melo TaxID=3656 RepID=A0A9I9EI75_CUCME